MQTTPNENSLREALKLFERNLQTPIVSGEQASWLQDACESFNRLEEILRPRLQQQMQSLDRLPAESTAVQEQVVALRQSVNEIASHIDPARHELERLCEQSKAVEPDELKLEKPIQHMIDRNLAFIVEVRRMDTASATLLNKSSTQGDESRGGGEQRRDASSDDPGFTGPNGILLIKEPKTKKDTVQEASEESFPASDPPSWTPLTST